MNLFKKIISKIRGEQDISKLKKMGLMIGDNCSIQPGCVVDPSHCFLIRIGNNVTLAPKVQIIAHDASTKRHLGYTKIGLVEIGDNSFIGAGAIILPGVKIGKRCIVGAGSVVTKNIADGVVVAGNPVKKITTTKSYLEKNKKILKRGIVYDASYRIESISELKKSKMKKALKKGIGFIE